MQTPDIGINLHAKADTERIYFKLKLQGLQAKLHVLQPLEVWVFYMNSVHKQAPPEVQMSFRTEKLLSEYCRPGYTSSNGQYIIDSIIIRINLSTAAFPVWRLVQRGGVSEDLRLCAARDVRRDSGQPGREAEGLARHAGGRCSEHPSGAAAPGDPFPEAAGRGWRTPLRPSPLHKTPFMPPTGTRRPCFKRSMRCSAISAPQKL